MSNRVVETIYRLRDQATDVLRRITGGYRGSATEAERASQRIEAANRRQQTSLQGVLASVSRVRFAYFAIAGALAGVVRGLARAAKASSDQENAERRLETALKNGVGARQEEIEALKEQAAALQQVTRFGDEATISAQAQLATFQLNAEAIQLLTPRALDLAEGMRRLGKDNVDVEQAAILLGKALRGNVGDLSRYGIVLTDAQKATVNFGTETEKVAALAEAIDANFKGLSTSLSPYEQAVQRAQNGTGDFVERLGAFVTTSPTVIAAIDAVTNSFSNLSERLASSGGGFERFVKGSVATLKILANTAQVIFDSILLGANRMQRQILETAQAVANGLSRVTFGDARKQLEEFVDATDQRLADLEESSARRFNNIGRNTAEFLQAGEELNSVIRGQASAQREANEASREAQNEALAQKRAAQEKQAALARTQETLKALGVDALAVETGVGEAARKTAQSLLVLAEDGEASLDILAAAADKAIAEFDAPAIALFQSNLEEAASAGKLSAQQYDVLTGAVARVQAQTGDAQSHFDRLNAAIAEANGHQLTNIASEIQRLAAGGKLAADEYRNLLDAIEKVRQANLNVGKDQDEGTDGVERNTESVKENTKTLREQADELQELTGRWGRAGGTIELAAKAQEVFNQKVSEWEGGGTARYISFWRRALEDALETTERINDAQERLNRLRDQGIDFNQASAESNRDLRRELAELRGEKERIAALEEQEQRRALQAQIDLAVAEGDREQVRLLEERRILLDQIAREEKKRAQERQREREKEQQEQERSSGPSQPDRQPSRPRASEPRPSFSSDININLNARADADAARLNPADLAALERRIVEQVLRRIQDDARRTGP